MRVMAELFIISAKYIREILLILEPKPVHGSVLMMGVGVFRVAR